MLRSVWPYGAMVARLTQDQKAGCSSHSFVRNCIFRSLSSNLCRTNFLLIFGKVIYFFKSEKIFRCRIILLLFSLVFEFLFYIWKNMQISVRKIGISILKNKHKKLCDTSVTRTPNILVWGQTRYHCAIGPHMQSHLQKNSYHNVLRLESMHNIWLQTFFMVFKKKHEI